METTISIHALLAESDIKNPEAVSKYMIFLSTLSLRRATTMETASKNRYLHFYPRSPCGERQASADCFSKSPLFLSTLSLRRATHWYHINKNAAMDFYPRSPCGERRWSVDVPGWILGISIHALLAESDSKSAQNNGALLHI